MYTNLYVKNVGAEVAFFKAIGFKEVGRENLGGYETVTVAPLKEGNACLQIWDVAFIRKLSPEVAESKPSLLFMVDDFDKHHEKVKSVAPKTSTIMDMNGRRVFNFQTINGDYMAFEEA